MINAQYINLNLIPSGVMPVLYCSQYDVGRPLGMVVYNGAESVDLSEYTCTIEATRTDRTPITTGVTTDGNIGVFETTATMTNQADTYKAKFVIVDGNGKRVASLTFVLCVTVATMDENAESIEEDASLYEQYTGTVQTIIAAIRADLAAEIIARQNAVSAEATARQNAITAEANARAAAVSAEATARQSADNTLQSNINAEASTRATQDASLQSQIDEIIAPSGEAPSAAEVENARIGSDGTVYPTLGDAIRTQNSDLKSQIDQISGSTRNVANIDDLIIGKAWNLANNSARAIIPVPVTPNTEYTLHYTSPNNFDLIYLVEKTAYDGSSVSTRNAQTPLTLTTKSTTNYFFIQFNKTDISKSDFVNFEIQLELGSNATQFVDHLTAVDEILRDTAIKTYNSVSSMKADMLIASGDRVQTLGYYSADDNGGARYLVRAIGTDTADDATIIQLNNGLVAELLVESTTINIKQLGAKPQDENRHDIAPYLAIFESKLRNKAKLYIPRGIWNCGGYLFTYPVHIVGDYVFTRKTNGGMIATIITFMSNGQDYLFKLSDNATRVLPDCVIENITFSNSVLTIDGNNYAPTGAYGAINDALVVADGLEFSTFNNLSFMFFNCTALDLKGCCELYFHNTNIRGKENFDPCIMIQRNSLRAVSSSIKFDFIQVEAIFGSIFRFKNYVTNCDFGSIMFEPNQPNSENVRIMVSDPSYDDSIMLRQSIFNLDSAYVQGCHVGNLCMDGFSAYGIKLNAEADHGYIYDTIFNGSSSVSLCMNIDSIELANALKDFYLFNNSNGAIGGSVSFVSFGSINVSSNTGTDKIIKPILNCQYVPKFSFRDRDNTAQGNMIYAYDLFRTSNDFQNTSVSIVGNNNLVNLSGSIAEPKCAIKGFTPGNNRQTIPNIRIPYCKMYKKMYVHYSATSGKESKLNFTNEDNVNVSWISEQALGSWNWAEIDISGLTVAEGYQDLNYEVEANSSGYIDCIALT